MFTAAVRALAEEATQTNERRMIVVTGDSEASCVDVAVEVCSTWGVPDTEVTLISEEPYHGIESISFDDTKQLLGKTLPGIIYCAHQSLDPDILAAGLGTIDGGGVFVLCCPDFASWEEAPDVFSQTLQVPPYSREDLSCYFRRRFITSLSQFKGIAIIEADTKRVIADGLTNPSPRFGIDESQFCNSTGVFSLTAYAACRTSDQRDALNALATLDTSNTPVVLTADRGRGKSAALGIAAAEYARMGYSVVITAPEFENVKTLFTHARGLLEEQPNTPFANADVKTILVSDAGAIRFEPPPKAVNESPDVLFVDEAASIGLPLLHQFLTVERVAFSTTTHGYEGTGQRFAVTFKPHLADARSGMTEVHLDKPIRYAPTDPLEPWLYHVLLLNASAPPDQTVTDATIDTCTYETLDPVQLAENEVVLQQVYGLLNHAHYKTEPSDLVRILDAPNIHVRALRYDGFVVAVALLAEEGGLDDETQAAMFAGERIRGNVIPDLLTSQLRDHTAGSATGIRIIRIATHPARRRDGLGSQLLTSIREEFAARKDWLGTSFSATSDLVAFWSANGFRAVHLSVRRNKTTGSHSVVMLDGLSGTGESLVSRHTDWFANRLLGLVTGAYQSIEPDVLIAVLRSIDTKIQYELSDRENTYLTESIDGPGTFEHNPLPFRKLGLNYFLDRTADELDPALERFVAVKLLQDRDWEEAADLFSFQSASEYHKQIPIVLKRLVRTSTTI